MYAYNTTRPPIPLKAYGRHITEIVQAVVQTPERAQRTAKAQAIVHLMKRMPKSLAARTDHDAQAWSDLFAIAGPTLDIESPYPQPPRKETPTPRPRMVYKSPSKYPPCCGHALTRLIHQVTHTKNQPSEDTLLQLLKCMQLIHKREKNPYNLLRHMEALLQKKIPLTPTLEKFLAKKTPEKKRPYRPYRNEKKY